MTVEEIRQKVRDENGNSDKFPVGMRVLAVDDDPTCLMLLDGLLRKCQYQVTTTSQARIALEMLRENRNRFDLVISDVHMPDMDGFKLLELVGLEMDLPVIMLSAYSDTKLVMNGITHGACDYLVKPVRIEELRNIWQHVLRRKKFDSKHQNKSTIQDNAQESEDAGQGTGNADQNGNLNRKRKEEEEEGEENGYENEDPATQKKPRVVWSIELHRKFVAAVNQLGIERAVPKRILDLMNVEGLTRENVASHLQKYRLYLKRISSVATQQANIVAALGCKDSSYMRIGSFNGVGETLAGSGRHSNSLISSYPPGGLLGRLNTSTGVSLHSLTSSALIQPNHVQNSSNSINSLGKFQPVVSPANLFQGIQTTPKFDLQQSKCTSSTREATFIADPTVFTAASTFAETSMAVCRPNNSLSGGLSNPLMLQGVLQQSQSGGRVTNQSSCDVTSFKPRLFNVSVSGSTSLDHGRCDENWQNAQQLSKFSTNSLSMTKSYNRAELPPNSLKEDASLTIPGIQSCPLDFSSISSISAPLVDSGRDNQWQSPLVGDILNTMNEPSQQWREHKQDYNHNSNHMFSAVSSLARANCDVGPLSQSFDQLDEFCIPKMNVALVGQSDAGASILMQHFEVERSTMESKMSSTGDYPLEQTKSHGGFVPNHNGSLDDLMNAMIKQEQDGTMTVDDEFGFDAYSFGSCL